MENIIIFGGGQIGSFSSSSLQRKGYNVIIADRNPVLDYIQRFGAHPTIVHSDILDIKGINKLFKKYIPSVVILSAGIPANLTEYQQKKARQIQVNGTRNVVELCLKHNVKKLIFISSIAVYGSLHGTGSVTESSPLNPQSVYGKIKVEAENTLFEYLENGLDILILRPSGIYGPIMLDCGSQSSRMIEKLLICGLNKINTTFEIKEDFKDEYLYVFDIADIIATIAESKNNTKRFIYNIGSGEITSVQKLEKAIKNIIPDSIFKFKFLPGNGLERRFLDITHIKEDYGFKIRYNTMRGLIHYYKNFIK